MLETFMRRLAGAAMLDPTTYEDVEGDRFALPQAMAVVVLSSIAAGVGAKGMSGSGEAASFMVSATALALMVWATWAVLMYRSAPSYCRSRIRRSTRVSCCARSASRPRRASSRCSGSFQA